MCIACDGVWDVMETKDVIQLVSLYAGQHPQVAARELVKEAEARWRRRRMPSDNVTAVVVFFNRKV